MLVAAALDATITRQQHKHPVLEDRAAVAEVEQEPVMGQQEQQIGAAAAVLGQRILGMARGVLVVLAWSLFLLRRRLHLPQVRQL